MLVPYYGNKKNNEKSYENNDYNWIELSKFLNILDENTIKKFEDLNGFSISNQELSKFEYEFSSYPPINLEGDNFIEFQDFLISSKLLFMTGFTCKYGYWKKGELNQMSNGKYFSHHGIDLILPKGTPIESFTKGIVQESKYGDGYGNYVVVKSTVNSEILYFCYEHLYSLNVSKGDNIEIGTVLGKCGNTGTSSGYHLHFQIDKDNCDFHPYWSSGQDDVAKTLDNCLDPWKFLRENFYNDDVLKKSENKEKSENKDDEVDLIGELTSEIDKRTKEDLNENTEFVSNSSLDEKEKYKSNDFVDNLMSGLQEDSNKEKDYINFFVNAGIIKGDDGDYKLEGNLTRYQMVLIIYRIYKNGLFNIELKEYKYNNNFSDIDNKLKKDSEFIKALGIISGNKIITGDDGKFLPWSNLTGDQFLAIVGRLFTNLKDGNKIWYKPYLDWAVDKNFITKDWPFIGIYIKRDEVLQILYKLIYNKNVV